MHIDLLTTLFNHNYSEKAENIGVININLIVLAILAANLMRIDVDT